MKFSKHCDSVKEVGLKRLLVRGASLKMTDFLTEYFYSGDEVLMSYFLVKETPLAIGIPVFYLVLCLWLGPTFMKHRPPFRIERIVVLYDILLVFINAYVSKRIIGILISGGWNVLCTDIKDTGETLKYDVAETLWLLYIIKYVELLDTILFILRKKFNNLTFLHVFHHATVPLITWFYYRSQARIAVIIYALINSVVHIVMYTYYGITAMGPQFQKYLRWKKYLTYLQLVQFLTMCTFLTFTLFSNCLERKTATAIYLFHAVILIALFANFYLNTYSSRKSHRSVQLNSLNGKEKARTD